MFRAKLHLRGNTLKGPNLFFVFFSRGVQYNRGDHYTNKISRFPVYYATSPGADAYCRDATKPRTSCSSRESALGGFELIPSSSCVARNKRSDVPNYWRCSFHLHFVYERALVRVLKTNVVAVLWRVQFSNKSSIIHPISSVLSPYFNENPFRHICSNSVRYRDFVAENLSTRFSRKEDREEDVERKYVERRFIQ